MDEEERLKMDRAGKNSKAFWDAKPVEPENELRDAPVKLERPARAFRWGDGTVPIVSVLMLAILFACGVGERIPRAKVAEVVSSRREHPENFAARPASNCFSARIHFVWLRLARGLPESRCWDV